MLLPLLFACRDDQPIALSDVDATVAVYDATRLLQVSLEMDADDWAALQLQTRDAFGILGGDDCQAEPFDDPFTPFPATVTLDGETVGTVGVRKKGFLGSLSTEKPGLIVKLDEYEELAWSGVDRLTLNNAVSDPSYVRQCLGYGLFADAGVPAPRCSFARVTVNGEDLGVYVNVEPVKRPFLARWFDDDGGNLYEGTLSDFREGWTGTLEKKTNEDEDDWSDIAALVAALQVDDDALMDTLDAVVDVDAFARFWAVEVVGRHVDGYASNTNNFFVYADPADGGRFRFVPWGIDEMFTGGVGLPSSVAAYGLLANRLYAHPDGRERYVTALDEVLEGAWDEDVLTARVDAMETLLVDEVDDRRTVRAAMDDVRDVVASRRGEIEDETGQGPIDWDLGMRDSYCFVETGSVTASFETWWGSLTTEDAFSSPSADLELVVDGTPWVIPDAGVVAGEDDDGSGVIVLAAWTSDTEAVLVWLATTPARVVPGELIVDFSETYGGLYYFDTETMEDWAFLSYVGGTVVLDQAGTSEGDAIVGTLEGALLAF